MIKNFVISLFFIFLVPSVVFAVTDDFTIKALVGSDTTPPTTPTMLTVIPVATTQIDVTWSTSTDDFLLAGYVLFRDGSSIATTTQTSFSDTGLTPETLYTYDVYAFDSSSNISTTSNSLATTTLAVPVTPTSTESVSSGSQSTRITALNNIEVSTTPSTATIDWHANRPAKYSLRWGRTDSYEGGYIINEAYKKSSKTTITGLEPGTTYVYEISGITTVGISVVLHKGEFKTSEIVKLNPPPNVLRLEAMVEKDDVRLSWQLPQVESISSVRVVRNHLGYPSGLYDGAVVYEGLDTSVLDIGVLGINSPQYYSVFVIDKYGNVSSGAVVRAQKLYLPENVIENPSQETPKQDNYTTSMEDVIPIENEEIPIFGFDVNNIAISQADKTFTFIDEKISINQDDSFVISIPYESLPKHLKSIVVTLLDPTNHKRSYSFLLRINKDRTAYEATIAPLNVIGISRLQVEIFDFERQIVGLYRKQIDFIASSEVSKEVVFPDKIVSSTSSILRSVISSGLSFLVLFLILLFLWRSRKTEDNL